MKTVILQSLTCLLIYLLVWLIIQFSIDVIGWFFMYLFIAGYLAFIVITSRYSWIVTILQFFVVGFLSFMIIGYLYNEIYEPYIKQNYHQFESEIATTIGLIELIIIKLFSDSILSKARIKSKKSLIEKMLLHTKPIRPSSREFNEV